MCISSCSFSIQPLHSQAQELTINFQNKEKGTLSSKQFIFTQQHGAVEGSVLHDVCSQNGICDQLILQKLFKDKDVQETESILKMSETDSIEAKHFFVLDLKGKKKSYLEDISIGECESVVLNFFKEKAPIGGNDLANKMHELFQESNLDYIFNEGSLKAGLIKKGAFAEPEAKYLLTKGKDKNGGKDFCQIAEFFLYGFKSGYESKEFKAESYIKPVSDDSEVFFPHQTSSVFYPSFYKELYAPDSTFCNALKAIYNIKSYFDIPSEVSKITVENPL